MDKGWIKLWRKINDNWLFSNPAYLAIWIDILIHASHGGDQKVRFRGETIVLLPGQFTAGCSQIGARRGIPPSSVSRILNLMKSERLIERQVDSKCSLITVLKWNEYQKDERQDEKQVRGRREANERQMRVNKELRREELTMKEESLIPSGEPSAPVGIQEVLKEFYKINPAIQFGSPPQRKAASELITRVGLEKLLPVVTSLASSNLDQYAPKIYSPVELRAKWSALADYWKRKQLDTPKSKFVNITSR